MGEKIKSKYRAEVDRALLLLNEIFRTNDVLLEKLSQADHKQICNDIHALLVRLDGRLQGMK